jgi:hypothetical protein
MPTVLLINGYRFFFFSNENSEPMHIHVEKAGANGKIMLNPIEIEYYYGFTQNEQKQIHTIVNENIEYLKKAWNDYFKQ